MAGGTLDRESRVGEGTTFAVRQGWLHDILQGLSHCVAARQESPEIKRLIPIHLVSAVWDNRPATGAVA